MNPNTLAIDLVRNATRITREELEAAMDGKVLPRIIGSTISTLIRRGHLVEHDDGRLEVGDEAAIEAAKAEREQRMAERDAALPGKPELPASVLEAATKPRSLDPKSHPVHKPGSAAHANALTRKMLLAVMAHGPLTAAEIGQHVPDIHGNNVYYHCKQLVERGELLKRGTRYAVTAEQFDQPAPVVEPTAPIVDVQAACAEAEEMSRPESKAERIRTIAEVAAKHARTVEDAGGVQVARATVGGVSVEVTAFSAREAARILAAAVAAINP